MFLVNNLTSICHTVLATLYSNINYITNDEENKLPSGSLKYIILILPLIPKITVNSVFSWKWQENTTKGKNIENEDSIIHKLLAWNYSWVRVKIWHKQRKRNAFANIYRAKMGPHDTSCRFLFAWQSIN